MFINGIKYLSFDEIDFGDDLLIARAARAHRVFAPASTRSKRTLYYTAEQVTTMQSIVLATAERLRT